MKFLALFLTLSVFGVQGWEIQPRRYLTPGDRSTTVPSRSTSSPGNPPPPTPPPPPPPPTGPPSAPWSVLGPFFNERRAKHGCPAWTSNDQLQSLAQECADFYQKEKQVTENPVDGADPTDFRACDTSKMSTVVDYYYVGGCDMVGQVSMIGHWLLEESKYTSYENPDMKKVGEYRHFTQIIWKSTESAACAISKKTVDGDATKCIHVCVFDAAGNVVIGNRNTQFIANVPEPL